MNIDIYTDGGAFPDQDFAAWAFMIPGIHPTELNLCERKSVYIHRSGRLEDSTSNGAEIMAVAFGLEFVANNINRLPVAESTTIYSDCDRPVDALNGLLERWAGNGWRTSTPAKKRTNAEGKRGLSEKDKWVFLYAQVKRIESLNLKIKAVKVPAHSGVYWNEKCDASVKHELAFAVYQRP